ncbi:MAG TPA: flavodoxin domain-containing protein [Bacteroidales bacterium]|nr:flavodoxin domain-containing protein [Bacteroidales bacterium]
MRTAIVYTTKHGTTRKVANKIKEMIWPGDVILFNLAETRQPEIRSFDRVIIGSSVYAGSVNGRVKLFVKQNMVELLQKEVGLFTCGMFFEKAEEQIEKSFPALLRQHARSIRHLGGEYQFDDLNFVERFLVKKIGGATQSESHIDEKAIEGFVEEFGVMF